MPHARTNSLPRIGFFIGEIVTSRFVHADAQPRTPPQPTDCMTDLEFSNHAEALLQALEAACDRLNEDADNDIDNQRVGGMITLTFANRSQIIVNLQRPLQEVWLAAKSGGYHYRFDGQHWQDTKGQGEFWQQLSADATVQSGLPLAFQGA
jgi:CyaY protein